MRYLCYLLFVITLLCACRKDKPAPIEPEIPETIVNLSPNDFTVDVDSITDQRAVVSWTIATDPDKDSVKYDIWLNDKLIIENVTYLQHIFSGLTELTKYSGKIVAKDIKNNQLAKPFSFTTEKYYLKYLKYYDYYKDNNPMNNFGGDIRQMIKMPDGSYIVVGSSFLGDEDVRQQLFAMKINYEGKEIWKKNYRYTIGPAYNVAACQSFNGVLIASHYNLLNIDSDGNLIWYKKIESYDNGDGSSEILSVKQDSKGDIFIAGGRASADPDKITEGVVTKLDQYANILWEKAYKPSLRGFFNDMEITPSNELIIFGTRETKGITLQEYYNGEVGQYDFWLVKLTNEGEEIWQNTYGAREFDIADKIILKRNGNIVFVGLRLPDNARFQSILYEISNDGSKISSNLIGLSQQSRTNSLAETLDGGIITVGWADRGYSESLEINKYNVGGKEEWNQQHYEFNTSLMGRSILAEEDGGYRILVAQGKYSGSGYGEPPHLVVYKTDPIGRYK